MAPHMVRPCCRWSPVLKAFLRPYLDCRRSVLQFETLLASTGHRALLPALPIGHRALLPALRGCIFILENRLEQASKAFWTIECVLSTLPGEAFKILFEAMVASVLDYGAPMWSYSVSPNTLERLQQHACRCFLGVGRKHALAALAGDMC